MGCIFWKRSRATKYFENFRGKRGKDHKESTKTSKRFLLFSKKNAVSHSTNSSDDEKKKNALAVVERPKKTPTHSQRPSMESGARSGHMQMRISRIMDVTGGERGAQVVAGWPSWLAAVAGEAINGWIPRKAESFEKLEKIGQGTYSSVFKARDLESNKIVALKKVRFANMDPESVRFMSREIIVLRRLDHPNVMKLQGLISSRVSGSLYLIFEYMEHDLAGLAATPGVKFTEAQIKCYMQQLLCGLDHCHSRGILHRDIKGANLLIDNDGNLKIGDFGLATFFSPNQKQTLTSRVVTLWYRSPELLLGSTDYGVGVDIWSSGCILAELFTRKPIMPGRTEVEQLHKIFKLCGSPSEEYWKRSKLPNATIFKPQQPYKRCVSEILKDFPASALALLDVLLAVESECRGTASSALESEFFTTNPLPCSPSTLPKYPPSKEIDVKLREDESRRQRVFGGKVRGDESIKKVSRVVPVLDFNVELQPSIENIKANEEESMKASGQAFGPPKNTEELSTHKPCGHHGVLGLSRFSNSIAIGGSSRFDVTKENSVNPHWPEERFSDKCNHLYNVGFFEDQEWSHEPKTSCVEDELPTSKESPVGYVPKKNQIHYSGPLMPPGGNIEEMQGYVPKKNQIHYSGPLMPPGGIIEEMLKEHERRIQDVIRKARLNKDR